MPLNIASASLTQNLPANALLRGYTVNVRADSANWMMLRDVGQVRIQPSTVQANPNGTSVVIDYGIPLTTAGAEVPPGATYRIRAAYRWRGDSFDLANPVYTSPDSVGVTKANFPEISSTRLQLELTTTVPQASAETVTVQLPALPADLEVRVNGGPVVWRYPGPRGAPGVDGWVTVTVNGQQLTQKEVDLTDTVAPLLGNPDSAASTQVTVELRARVPGKLAVVPGTANYDLLEKVPVQPDPDLDFEQEGAQDLTLFLASGSNTALKEVWLTVASSPPRERAVPAVGPPRAQGVELVLDSGRSACVRFPNALDPGQPEKLAFAELTALRLPLLAQDGTAEVRAQLLAPVGTAPLDEPGPPLDGPSATEPVTLEPAPASRAQGSPPQDSWTLLPFKKPVTLKTPVWVSLRVTRGTVRWALASFGTTDGPPYPVRRGAPTGPWLPLPEAVTALTGLGGRLHAIGHPPKASPLAPLQLHILGPGFASPLTDVIPSAKGVLVKLVLAGPSVPAQACLLRVISRVSTTVTVQSLIRVVARP